MKRPTIKRVLEVANQLRSALPEAQRPSRKETRAAARKIRKILPATFAPVRDFNLEEYMRTRVFDPDAREFLRQTFDAPSRHISNRVSHNIHFPLVRFGVALKAESRDFEFTVMLYHAMRTDVVAIAEQPPKLPQIDLESGGWTEPTHDLVVLTLAGVEVYETRSRARLAKATLRQRKEYQLKGNEYVSPEIEAFYQKWGFKFQATTEDRFDPKFIQAVKPLLAYQAGSSPQPITPEEREFFVNWVAAHPGRRLGDMPMNETRRAELVQYFLAWCVVFARYSEIDWQNLNGIRLYLTPQDEAAFHRFLEGARHRPADLKELGYHLRHGSLIEIDCADFEVAKLDSDTVQLYEIRKKKLLDPISHRQLLDLEPRIGHVVDAEKTFEKLWEEAGPEGRAVYYARKMRVEEFLPGGSRANETPTERGIRQIRDHWRLLERNGRCGDEAFFSGYYRCGRKPAKWHSDAEKAFRDGVDRLLLQPRDAKVKWLIDEMETRVPVEKLPQTRVIYRRIKKTVDAWHRKRSVVGLSGALDFQPVQGDSDIHGPLHCGRAGMRAHVDSSPVAVALTKAKKGLWVSKMVDDCTGRILADIQYEGHPTAVTERALILECIARNGYLPAELVFDGGAENRTRYMQESLLALGVRLDYRRRKHPRDGGAVENSFYIELVELLANVPGSSKHEAEFMKLDKWYRAKNFALLTPDELGEIRVAYVALSNRSPRKNGKASPDGLQKASDEEWGPPPRQMPNVSQMRLVLQPPVPGQGGMRKVSTRGTIRCLGKKWGIKGERNPLRRFAGRKFLVRHNPDDKETSVSIFAESPTKGMKLVCVNRGGPAAKIMAAAKAYDEERLAEEGPLPTVYSIVQPVIAKAEARQREERKQARRAQRCQSAANETRRVQIAPIAF